MGACDFTTVAIGPDMKTAFVDACEQAAYEHGHGGYTGTIAEKRGDGYVVVTFPGPLPADVTAFDMLTNWTSAEYRDECENGLVEIHRGGRYVNGEYVSVPPTVLDREWSAWLMDVASKVCNKWGPAGACDVTDTVYGQEVLEGKHYAEVGSRGPKQRVFVFFGLASS